MAIRADFYVDVALVSRARSKAVAAGAHDADFVISGMNSWFHVCFGPQCESLDSKRRARDSANSRGASVVENHSAFIDVAPHARSLAPPEKRLCSGGLQHGHRQSEGRLHRRAGLARDGPGPGPPTRRTL